MRFVLSSTMAQLVMTAGMLWITRIVTGAPFVTKASVKNVAAPAAVAMRRFVTVAPSCAPIVKRVSVLTA